MVAVFDFRADFFRAVWLRNQASGVTVGAELFIQQLIDCRIKHLLADRLLIRWDGHEHHGVGCWRCWRSSGVKDLYNNSEMRRTVN